MAGTAPQDNKRGYLVGDFRLFHIRDKRAMDFDSHYHDFHKLILCLNGSVEYMIEDKSYRLEPSDILLVPAHVIHHSRTDDKDAYERMVLFIDEAFLGSLSRDPGERLDDCFLRAANEGRALLRVGDESFARILKNVKALENAMTDADFASDTLQNACFTELIVRINRASRRDNAVGNVSCGDPKIEEIIRYINGHYAERLTLEELSKRFYLSKSYLMHRFREVTGGSVHAYLCEKRLSVAVTLLREGKSVGETASLCGFSDYTVFYRSFRKKYGYSPGELNKNENDSE